MRPADMALTGLPPLVIDEDRHRTATVRTDYFPSKRMHTAGCGGEVSLFVPDRSLRPEQIVVHLIEDVLWIWLQLGMRYSAACGLKSHTAAGQFSAGSLLIAAFLRTRTAS